MFKNILYKKYTCIFSIALEIKTHSRVLCSSFTSLESYLMGTALLNRITTTALLKFNFMEIMSYIQICNSE